MKLRFPGYRSSFPTFAQIFPAKRAQRVTLGKSETSTLVFSRTALPSFRFRIPLEGAETFLSAAGPLCAVVAAVFDEIERPAPASDDEVSVDAQLPQASTSQVAESQVSAPQKSSVSVQTVASSDWISPPKHLDKLFENTFRVAKNAKEAIVVATLLDRTFVVMNLEKLERYAEMLYALSPSARRAIWGAESDEEKNDDDEDDDEDEETEPRAPRK